MICYSQLFDIISSPILDGTYKKAEEMSTWCFAVSAWGAKGWHYRIDHFSCHLFATNLALQNQISVTSNDGCLTLYLILHRFIVKLARSICNSRRLYHIICSSMSKRSSSRYRGQNRNKHQECLLHYTTGQHWLLGSGMERLWIQGKSVTWREMNTKLSGPMADWLKIMSV